MVMMSLLVQILLDGVESSYDQNLLPVSITIILPRWWKSLPCSGVDLDFLWRGGGASYISRAGVLA